MRVGLDSIEDNVRQTCSMNDIESTRLQPEE